MGTGLLSGGQSGRVVKLTTLLYLAPRLRLSGAIPPFPLHAFVALTRTTFTFFLLRFRFSNIILILKATKHLTTHSAQKTLWMMNIWARILTKICILWPSFVCETEQVAQVDRTSAHSATLFREWSCKSDITGRRSWKSWQMGNNYLEDTISCLFRDNVQKWTGEAKGICKTLNKSISEPFSDSERVLIKHKPVILPIHYPCP
jgi:hypothetical protein